MILFMTGALRCSVLCLFVCVYLCALLSWKLRGKHCYLGNSVENVHLSFSLGSTLPSCLEGCSWFIVFLLFSFFFFPFSWVFNQCNFVSWWRFLLEKVTWVWKVVGKQEVKKGKSLSIIIYVNKSQFRLDKNSNSLPNKLKVFSATSYQISHQTRSP